VPSISVVTNCQIETKCAVLERDLLVRESAIAGSVTSQISASVVALSLCLNSGRVSMTTVNACLFLLFLPPMHLSASCDVFTNTNFNVLQNASTCQLVTKCVFENINSSTDGGAIYFRSPFSSIHFMRLCTFRNCGCEGKGGARFNNNCY
jgi:hypothetical protein